MVKFDTACSNCIVNDLVGFKHHYHRHQCVYACVNVCVCVVTLDLLTVIRCQKANTAAANGFVPPSQPLSMLAAHSATTSARRGPAEAENQTSSAISRSVKFYFFLFCLFQHNRAVQPKPRPENETDRVMASRLRD